MYVLRLETLEKKEFLSICPVRKQCIVPREMGRVFQEMSVVLRFCLPL